MRVQFTVEFEVEDHEGLKAALEEIPGCIRATKTSEVGSRDPEFPIRYWGTWEGDSRVVLRYPNGGYVSIPVPVDAPPGRPIAEYRGAD